MLYDVIYFNRGQYVLAGTYHSHDEALSYKTILHIHYDRVFIVEYDGEGVLVA